MTGTADPRHERALDAHRAGRLAEAIQLYQAMLRDRPDDAGVIRLCGLAALQAGAADAAVTLIGNALKLSPWQAGWRDEMGQALAQQGWHADAYREMRRALLVEPGRPPTAFNAAMLLRRLLRPAESAAVFRWSTRLQPGHAESWVQHAANERAGGRLDAAEAALATAAAAGGEAEVLYWFHLGNLRADQGRHAGAEAAWRKAVALNPRFGEAHANLGNLLRMLGRREDSVAAFSEGIQAEPNYAPLWSGISATAYEQDQIAEALATADHAIALDASLADGHANRAQCLARLGQLDLAVQSGRAALAMKGEDPVLHFNLGTYLLAAGQLGEGWREYAWRRETAPRAPEIGLPDLLWRTGQPPGRRLLVTAEQGLGDEILFASCLPDLASLIAEGALEQVIWEADRRLLPLLERAFPGMRFLARLSRRDGAQAGLDYGAAIAEVTPPDCWLPAGNLPRLFRGAMEAFPPAARFLAADPATVAHWRGWLDSLPPGRRLGFCWRSRAGRDREAAYYPALEDWAPLLARPGLALVNLQYDRPDPDLARLAGEFGLTVIEPPGLDLFNDLPGVAALIEALDGVVSAHTSVINLAGALGQDGFMAAHAPAWTFLGTESLPWYPSLRVAIRQPEEAWADTLARLQAKLEDWLAN
jgi:tetratricopeptide (TPR) repeat protein